jgi:hypothetical protein
MNEREMLTDDDVHRLARKYFGPSTAESIPETILMYTREIERRVAARRTTPDREAWISVDDRLPEEGQDIAFIVKAAKGSIQDHINGRVLGGRFMIMGSYPTFTVPGLGFNASHWMPLPAAPTSDQGEKS